MALFLGVEVLSGETGKEKAEKENQKFIDITKSVQERKRDPQASRPLRRLTREDL